MNKETTNKYGFRSCHSERGQKPSVGIFTNQDCRVALRIAPRNDGKRETRDKYLNQKGFAPILLILFFIILGAGLGAGVYLVQKTQIFKPKAAAPSQNQIQVAKPDPAIESLTNQLLQMDKQYDQIQPVPSASPAKGSNVKGEQTSAQAQAQLNNMVEVAKKREDLLVKKVEQDPQGFLVDANLADKADNFPQKVKEHIEHKIQGGGTLEILHSHDFTHQKSENNYFLNADDKSSQKYNIHFSEKNPDLPANAKVVINSVAISDDTAVTKIQNEIPSPDQKNKKVLAADSSVGTLQILSAPGIKAALPGLKIGVVLVKYADAAEPLFTKSQVEAAVSDNIKPYYKELSKGDDLNVDVLGFYPIPSAQISCDHNVISGQVDPLVGASVISKYDKIVYVLPHSGSYFRVNKVCA